MSHRLVHGVLHMAVEWDRAGRVTERQPGMSRETTDRERSVLFVQVCVCVWERVCLFLCVSVGSTLFAREWLWAWNVVPVRAFFFFKSETHWHFKQTGDISVANSSLFSFLLESSVPRLYPNLSHFLTFFIKSQPTKTDWFAHEHCRIYTVESHMSEWGVYLASAWKRVVLCCVFRVIQTFSMCWIHTIMQSSTLLPYGPRGTLQASIPQWTVRRHCLNPCFYNYLSKDR